ncbi:hypothetical protein Cyrtocomes_01114 [Candidatus Cyrtobacter comes]|uniref:Uncharacterized protein n=1 Tax=Candidatus Cyrtobacter comes TaxID=675776 RepID=A0ABU5L9C5_9RICK|nr:hypothetical protein [Candidatus Cyrtobacter comes]MDZ5762720.1 hypothetical protein [Candidatus Cyrtobacter comes]
MSERRYEKLKDKCDNQAECDYEAEPHLVTQGSGQASMLNGNGQLADDQTELMHSVWDAFAAQCVVRGDFIAMQ